MTDCAICGYGHRYQFPSGSDADGHQASAIACANSVLHDIDVMLSKDDPDAAAFVRQRIDGAITRLGQAINDSRPKKRARWAS